MKKNTENKIINYGFQTPVIEQDQYIFGGALGYGNILQGDGQWDNFLPIYEPQAEKYETQGCTVWGTQNALEILFKRLWNVEFNFSERYNYILSDIDYLKGGDPHNVCERIRKYDGLIPQEMLPVPDTLKDFLTPRPMTAEYLTVGWKFLNEYDIKHDWVLEGEYKIWKLQEALMYSPIACSVSAWYKNGEVYEDMGMPNNHWVVCYGWTDKGWKIFDSYDHSLKIYSFDSKINFAKRFVIMKKENVQKLSIIGKILEAIKQALGLIGEQVKQLPVDTPLVSPMPSVLDPVLQPIIHPILEPNYKWDTKENIRHSIRVICDEMGLLNLFILVDGKKQTMKDVICACIQQESQFNPKAVSKPNKNGTRDWGLVQINDGGNAKGEKFWIGKGKLFKDTDEVLNDPEKGVRFMVRETKRYGYPKWWDSFKTGAYKKYL